MARPERVVVWHVHMMLDSSLIRRGDRNVHVDTSLAQLFHYRRAIAAADARTAPVYRQMEFESRILRRLNVATAAVCPGPILRNFSGCTISKVHV